MGRLGVCCLLLLGCVVALAPAQEAAEPSALALWPEGAPGALGTDRGQDRNPGDVPTLTLYRPTTVPANGTAVVICPGGGYGMLATDHEGRDVARWLNSLGITAGVLRYRLGPKYRHPAPLQDAQRAVRMMRVRASEWAINPQRIGILGFSAGGHLASTALTHFDAGQSDATDPLERASARPDFGILVYPVISLGTEYGHGGSRKNLLGDNPDPALLRSLTNETQVTKFTPPVFLAHTAQDTAVPPENSMLFASALRKAGVPFEMHIFEQGVHGLGLGTGAADFRIAPDAAFQAWPGLCAEWLRVRGLIPTPSR